MSESSLILDFVNQNPARRWGLRELEELKGEITAELQGEINNMERVAFSRLLEQVARQLSDQELHVNNIRARLGRPRSTEDALFRGAANIVDLLLEPESAESAIGDLEERYRRRVKIDAAHAKRWLIIQVGWLAFGRAMELLGRFSAARAGK
jgi:hypothetical protein